MRVVAADLSGLGETLAARAPRDRPGDLFDRNVSEFYRAYLNDRSLVGIRPADPLAGVRHLVDA